jgi:putative endonuclease
MTQIGQLGEQFVAQWFISQGGIILHQRWRCRWGEIDLIGQLTNPDMITFIEVKTRSRNNWDEGGLLAITPQKQMKICRTVAVFFSKFPQLADSPCRFDVAIVNYQISRQANKDEFTALSEEIITIGKPVLWQGYQWILQEYIEAAFEGVFDIE